MIINKHITCLSTRCTSCATLICLFMFPWQQSVYKQQRNSQIFFRTSREKAMSECKRKSPGIALYLHRYTYMWPTEWCLSETCAYSRTAGQCSSMFVKGFLLKCLGDLYNTAKCKCRPRLSGVLIMLAVVNVSTISLSNERVYYNVW